MLFGDDALYYQIVKDAHDPDPAVAWRHVPFRRVPARTVPQVAPAPDVAIIADRLNVGLRALLQRVRPRPAASARRWRPLRRGGLLLGQRGAA